MISKKERSKAWEDRWVAEAAEQDARDHVVELRKAGFEKGDPDFDAALEDLGKAVGAHTRARLNIGTKARKERPLASLPFQLQSFAMSQASKLVSSALTGRDKHVLAGFMGMWGAGILASWLKGEVSGTNDNAAVDEHLFRGLTSTGFLTWMGIPFEGARGLSRVMLGEQKLETPLGEVGLVDEDRPGVQDNSNILGPGASLMIGGMEAMFGTGFDGKDIPPSDRVYQLRRMIPFGNLIYFNRLMRLGFNQFTDLEDEGGGPGGAPALSGADGQDEYGFDVEKMMGFTVGDDDPREPRADPTGDAGELAELEGMEAGDLIARLVADKRRSKRPRRPALQPLGLQF